MATYNGHSIDFEMDGAKPIFKCRELGLEAGTIEEIKKLINAEKERVDAAPKIKALWLSWNMDEYQEVIVGAKSNSRYNSEYWISYKEGGKSKRKKESPSGLYRDTPKNRAILDKLMEIRRKIKTMNDEAIDLKYKLVTIDAD